MGRRRGEGRSSILGDAHAQEEPSSMEFDANKGWHIVQERLDRTTNPRHRKLLEVLRDHLKAEATSDFDLLLSTLAPDPEYKFWVSGNGFGAGPKGVLGPRRCDLSRSFAINQSRGTRAFRCATGARRPALSVHFAQLQYGSDVCIARRANSAGRKPSRRHDSFSNSTLIAPR